MRSASFLIRGWSEELLLLVLLSRSTPLCFNTTKLSKLLCLLWWSLQLFSLGVLCPWFRSIWSLLQKKMRVNWNRVKLMWKRRERRERSFSQHYPDSLKINIPSENLLQFRMMICTQSMSHSNILMKWLSMKQEWTPTLSTPPIWMGRKRRRRTSARCTAVDLISWSWNLCSSITTSQVQRSLRMILLKCSWSKDKS